MRHIILILITLSVGSVFADENDTSTINEDSNSAYESSFLDDFYGVFSSSDNADAGGVESTSYLEHDLLIKNKQLEAELESHKIQTNKIIKVLEDKIHSNTRNLETKSNELLNKVQDARNVTRQDIEKLQNKYNQLSADYIDLNKDYKSYRESTVILFDNLQKSVSATAKNLKNTEKNTTESLSILSETLSKNSLYWIISILLIILLVVLSFIFSRKLVSKHRTDVVSSLQDTRKGLEEEHVRLDSKLIEIIESQLNIINSKNLGDSNDEDHTLALKVADEIVRIQKNITRMDKKTKGLKQLSASVTRIEDNFSSNGYEIVDMLNKPYNEGMKVTANFIPDDELDEGQQIITRIIKPQVNYQDVMIQSAQIEVSQGE